MTLCQTGDPSGTGTGSESIYGEPFKDEFHSRLRFSHRWDPRVLRTLVGVFSSTSTKRAFDRLTRALDRAWRFPGATLTYCHLLKS